MPNIILKKTSEAIVENQHIEIRNTTESYLSLHGTQVDDELVQALNGAIQNLPCYARCGKPTFEECKYNQMKLFFVNVVTAERYEEDIICAILDEMEVMGWKLRFQGDGQTVHARYGRTTKQQYIFSKEKTRVDQFSA